jgi:hypothetical protein
MAATSLLELVRRRREELEQAQPELRITDEQRIAAVLSLQAQAAQGDPDAKSRMEAIRRLFDQVRRQAPDAAEGPYAGSAGHCRSSWPGVSEDPAAEAQEAIRGYAAEVHCGVCVAGQTSPPVWGAEGSRAK